jgi:hypothetical protein
MTQKTQVQQAQWKGSMETFMLVQMQIAERFGAEAAEEYDPDKNCFTFTCWLSKGFAVKKGEHALKSYTVVGGREVEDEVTHEKRMVGGYKKTVNLFFHLQVEKDGTE